MAHVREKFAFRSGGGFGLGLCQQQLAFFLPQLSHILRCSEQPDNLARIICECVFAIV